MADGAPAAEGRGGRSLPFMVFGCSRAVSLLAALAGDSNGWAALQQVVAPDAGREPAEAGDPAVFDSAARRGGRRGQAMLTWCLPGRRWALAAWARTSSRPSGPQYAPPVGRRGWGGCGPGGGAAFSLYRSKTVAYCLIGGFVGSLRRLCSTR